MSSWLLGHRVLVSALSRGAVAGVVTEVPATSAPDHQVLIALIAALGSIGVALITGVFASGYFRRQQQAASSGQSAEVTEELARLAKQERERAEALRARNAELERELDEARRAGP